MAETHEEAAVRIASKARSAEFYLDTARFIDAIYVEIGRAEVNKLNAKFAADSNGDSQERVFDIVTALNKEIILILNLNLN